MGRLHSPPRARQYALFGKEKRPAREVDGALRLWNSIATKVAALQFFEFAGFAAAKASECKHR